MYIKNFGDTNFITGLRAYAILGVLLIHSGGSGLRQLGVWGNNLTDLGKHGVIVFFVISGFIIADSYTKRPHYFSWIVRRILRIAPLYYFWILIAIFSGQTSKYWMEFFDVERITTTNILMHLLFIGYLDYTITNSILGVEWSLSIEVFYYVLFPLIIAPLIKANNNLKLIGVVLFTYLTWIFLYMPSLNGQSTYLIFWSPLPYLISYLIGVISWQMRNKIKLNSKMSDSIIIINLIIFVALINNLSPFIESFSVIVVSFMTGSLLISCNNKAKLTKVILLNPLIQFIGILSYGIYLCHFFIINWIQNTGYSEPLTFFIVIISSLTISFFTYHLIERPFRALGQKI
jgi:peptidoglycan/LPS O-acetylase OafA/YrhL